MRKALAWLVLGLVFLSFIDWGEVRPYVAIRVEKWSPLARAIASGGPYGMVVPQAAGTSRGLQLFVAEDGSDPLDFLFCYSGPGSRTLASDLVARCLASDDPAYREQVAGSFTAAGEGWAVAWLGPPQRAAEAKRAVALFGGPGSGMPPRTAASLISELRAVLAFEGGSISTERLVYLLFGVGKRLARPGVVLLRAAAVLAPDGPVWAWVCEGATLLGIVCLALALGGFRPFRRRRRPEAAT